MASAKKVAPLLIGGGLIYLLTKASNAIQTVRNLSVQLGRIKNVNFKGLSIDVTLELQVNNPGSVDIPFEYYTGTITHAGSKISSFTFNGTGQNIVFKRYSLTPVTFVLSISSINLVYQLVQLVTDIKNGRKVDSMFYIASTLHTTGVDIPVNFSYDIKPGAVNGLGKIRFGKFIKKAAGFTPLGAKLFHKRKGNNVLRPIAGIGSINMNSTEQKEFVKASKKFYEWCTQKLQSGYTKQYVERVFLNVFTKNFSHYFSNIINGNYGQGVDMMLDNMYIQMPATESGRQSYLLTIAKTMILVLASEEMYYINQRAFYSLCKKLMTEEETAKKLKHAMTEIETHYWGWMNDIGIKF